MEYSVNVSFRCSPHIERRIRVEAAKRDMNRTEFIIEALAEKLERIDAKSAQDKDQSNS